VALSWRLVLAPPYVLDYLAAHEVAHRREMNHGARFWRLVHTLAPQTDRAEAWLKGYGRGLHRYGAAPASTERE
jgi:predicted metal-dependent hydrolase